MDGVYRGKNYLSVNRTPYRAVTNNFGAKKQTDVTASKKKAGTSKGTDVPQVKTALKDTYRASLKPSRAANANTVMPQKKDNSVKGFVYVEHSGFKGTLRDAFHTKRVKSGEKSCFDKIVMVLMFAVLMFFVAGSYCEYYEAFMTTNEIRSEISRCREEQAKLLVAIDERNNRLGIEQYAEDVLGMVKSDTLTTYYIDISEKDFVSISVNEDGGAGANGVLLSGFKSVMSNLFDKN